MALPVILAEIGAASTAAALLRFEFLIFAETRQPGLWRNLPWCYASGRRDLLCGSEAFT
jgi:hypothetical protein